MYLCLCTPPDCITCAAKQNKIKAASIKLLWEKLSEFISNTIKQQKGVLLSNLGNFRVRIIVLSFPCHRASLTPGQCVSMKPGAVLPSKLPANTLDKVLETCDCLQIGRRDRLLCALCILSPAAHLHS